MRFVASVLILLILTSSSPAQLNVPEQDVPATTPNQPNGADVRPPAAKKELDRDAVIANLKKIVAELSNQDGSAYKALQEYSAYYYMEYAKRKLDVQIAAFEWQQSASEKLIWLVVLMSVAWVVFSGFQLWRATQVVPGRDNQVELTTELQISAQQVRITSSVVGIVVLLISIIYLYLFLKEVYVISVLPDSSVANTTHASKSASPQ